VTDPLALSRSAMLRPDAASARFRPARLAAACLVAGAAWIVAEVAGGLFLLALGVRLWRYELMPLFWAITSPIVWLFALTLIVPLSIVYDRLVARRWTGRARFVARALFVMSVGPVLEVLINEFLFKAGLGRALYVYTVLPTFSGSGSWLSPLYYATLLIHVPITDRLLGSDALPGAAAPARTPR
jgi:hypothetical protein